VRITDNMVVADSVPDSDAIIRNCPEEGPAFHVPQKVMVLSAGGARSMRLWTCEKHPLPRTITDVPDED
jgi:hypothetical protein